MSPQIIADICQQRGVQLIDEVVDLVASNLRRDVRRLYGAVNRLHAVSIATNDPVTADFARQHLSDLFSINGTHTSMKAIEKVVCDFCHVKPGDLKSPSRQKKLSAARMLAMYLSRRHTSHACSEIGDHFGGRTHSTVIAAEKKVSGWLDQNAQIDLPHCKICRKGRRSSHRIRIAYWLIALFWR